MIRQPFSSAELQAMTAAAPLSEHANVRGMAGYRTWNVTPWWWELRAEGDVSRLLGLIAPWHQAEGNFEGQELQELVITAAVDLPQLPLPTAIPSGTAGWRWMEEFTPDPLDQRSYSLVGNASMSGTVQTQLVSLLPVSATPNNASSGDVANVAATATLAAVPGQFNYLTGFTITGAGATGASVVTATVSGISGGPLAYDIVVPAGAGVSITPLVVSFAEAVRSSAVNTAIVVNVPAFGVGNLHAAVSATGFVSPL